MRLGMIGAALLGLPLWLWAGPNLALVKYANGDIRTAGSGADSSWRNLHAADLLLSGQRVVSGLDGKAALRFIPDQAFLEVRPKTAFLLKRIKSGGKPVRKVSMESGEVVFGLKKKSPPVQCENSQTLVSATAARFSCAVDDKSAAILVVQDGEITVYNRPKDISAVARRGQKAVSDLSGIRISDASDSELEQVGFRQNTLEVDFLNPQSEEFTTLEVEYETQF